MIADPTRVLLPDKSDLSQIRSRAGKKRGRPAAQADSDSMDEKRKKPKEFRREKEPELEDGMLPDSDEDDKVDLLFTYMCITSNLCVGRVARQRRKRRRSRQGRNR